MMAFLNARLIARVVGLPVVMVAALAAFVFFARTALPDWLKLIGLLIIGSVIVASAFRMWKGGEQGATDLEMTEDRIAMSNIPLNVVADVLRRGLNVYERRPLPRPGGVIRGIPAENASAVELASAGLPEHTEVAEGPIEVPEDAAALSVDVAEDIHGEDAADMELSPPESDAPSSETAR